MTGSMRSAILFVIGAVLEFVQAAVSIALLDDAIGGILGVGFGIIMLLGAFLAYSGHMSIIYEDGVTQEIPGGRIVEKIDTGQRIQMTPCCGICTGLGAIIIATALAAPLIEVGLFFVVLPAIIGGIFGILAAVVFMIDYKGQYQKFV